MVIVILPFSDWLVRLMFWDGLVLGTVRAIPLLPFRETWLEEFKNSVPLTDDTVKLPVPVV